MHTMFVTKKNGKYYLFDLLAILKLKLLVATKQTICVVINWASFTVGTCTCICVTIAFFLRCAPLQLS